MPLFKPAQDPHIIMGTVGSVTGTTAETVVGTAAIPGGALGANGTLRVTFYFTCTNSANTKTIGVRVGGLAGTSILAAAQTTVAGGQILRTVTNVNSQSIQNCAIGTATPNSFTTSTVAPTSAAINTSVDWTLVVTGTLTNTGESIDVLYMVVEIFHAD